MTKRMLIDANHAEETRVVVLDGNRLEDFDVETSTKKQLKGNIYLAKIVRVEPSLQAAFVEYGGARHGFLAFGEIHPDYYQIPIADRQRLVAQQEQEAREAEEADDAAARAEEAGDAGATASNMAGPAFDDTLADASGADTSEGVPQDDLASNPNDNDIIRAANAGSSIDPAPDAPDSPDEPAEADAQDQAPLAQPASMHADQVTGDAIEPQTAPDADIEVTAALEEFGLTVQPDGQVTGTDDALADLQDALADAPTAEASSAEDPGDIPTAPQLPPPETLGGEHDTSDDTSADRESRPPRFLRNYKIQEVIRRRQIMLVQVVKEERGGKGAALTTYISLAGRFCVLMPNSPRGGGISRKITSTSDRRRLKEITAELEIPSGMGLIVRTAGAARPKPEIRRDCEYLLQLWDDIRDTTMKSIAPAAIYEEASLIKRAIRDVYSRDVDEVVVDGEAAWRAARDQMRLLMPGHSHKVQLWSESTPLFAHHQVDVQLDAMLSPTVQLKSGGYLVINQTEALVAIDVNSGRSTRERGIEETALRTNSEAAEEVARQLRLRDLAGLIVIDFIDMEQRRNNATVERKLKDALRNDRARIQLGSISHFGLMEMSRQRLRPSFAETSFVQCASCGGTGLVRSTEGAAIHVLRAIEEEGGKRRSAEIMVNVAGPIAMYILNHKRALLAEIEARYGMSVLFTPDPALLPPAVRIDRLRQHEAGQSPPVLQRVTPTESRDSFVADEADADVEDEGKDTVAVATTAPETADGATDAASSEATRRRRRRRRRGGGRSGEPRDDQMAAEPNGDDEPSGPDPFTPALTALELDEPGVSNEPGASEVPAIDPAILSTHDETIADAGDPADDADAEDESGQAATAERTAEGSSRRRGRRGGRRRRKDAPGETSDTQADLIAPKVQAPPAPPPPRPAPAPLYTGPTPANPFGGDAFDIFDVMERAEEVAANALYASSPTPAPLPKAATVKPGSVELPAATPEPEPEPTAVSPAEPEPPLAELPVAEPPVAEQPEPAPPVRAKPPTVRRTRKAVVTPAPAELFEPAADPLPDAPAPQSPSAVAEPAEPLVKPVLADDAPASPRRGWWKR